MSISEYEFIIYCCNMSKISNFLGYLVEIIEQSDARLRKQTTFLHVCLVIFLFIHFSSPSIFKKSKMQKTFWCNVAQNACTACMNAKFRYSLSKSVLTLLNILRRNFPFWKVVLTTLCFDCYQAIKIDTTPLHRYLQIRIYNAAKFLLFLKVC